MARVKNNALLAGISGRIGNSLIIKQYSYGTVLSAMPDMSKVKKSKLQKLKQTDFAKAVAYAQSIIRDKKKKEKYAKTIEEGKTVYHAAIKEYLDKMKEG
jgi:ribosomal protein L18